MTASAVHAHHALEVTHPHLRNGVALAGDAVYPVWRLVRRIGRGACTLPTAAVDWIEAHLDGVMQALVALVAVMGFTVLLVLAGLHLLAIVVGSIGLLVIVFAVGYWAGGRS